VLLPVLIVNQKMVVKLGAVTGVGHARLMFFQQSNVIDKRITPRFIGYERADTILGAFIVVGSTTAVTIVAVYAVRGTGPASNSPAPSGSRTPSGSTITCWARCSRSCCSTRASSPRPP